MRAKMRPSRFLPFRSFRNCMQRVNGSSFDLPVLRYRAMVHGVAAPGLASRPYFNRYTEDAVDLCDLLSSFSPHTKAGLHELSRVMGLPGKPDGISGAEVRSTTATDIFARSPSTVRAMCSTRIGFGCGMNSFEAGYLMLSFRRARPASWISSRHAGIPSLTLLISCSLQLGSTQIRHDGLTASSASQAAPRMVVHRVE